jgi:hypothetical protein
MLVELEINVGLLDVDRSSEFVIVINRDAAMLELDLSIKMMFCVT